MKKLLCKIFGHKWRVRYVYDINANVRLMENLPSLAELTEDVKKAQDYCKRCNQMKNHDIISGSVIPPKF